MDWNACTGVIHCAYDYQELIAGVLAIFAAIIGGWIVLKSARLPVEAENERLQEIDRRNLIGGGSQIIADLRWVSLLAKQAKGTIKTTIATNADANAVRERTIIPEPNLLLDREFMALFTQDTIIKSHEFRHELELHNFNMRRAGGAFGDDNFRRRVIEGAERLTSLANALANQFQSEVNLASQVSEDHKNTLRALLTWRRGG